MFTTNLQLLLVTFTIKVALKITYRKKKKNTQKKNFFTKLFQPRKHAKDKNAITFTRTYNPNHEFSFNKFKNCIKSTANIELQKAFNDKKYSLQHNNQRN